MSAPELDNLWIQGFPDSKRPRLYIDNELDDDGFQRLTDAENFITDTANYSHLQLFAASLNNQMALKAAQDEYLSLNQQIADIKGKDSQINDPQILPGYDEFEYRKEADLYNYKYEPPKPILFQNGLPGHKLPDEVSEQEKRDVHHVPDPFSQGGFVPNERQYRGMLARAKGRANVDGWEPVMQNGKALLPVQNKHRDEYSLTYVKRGFDENGEVIRPDSEASDDSLATPSKAVDKRLTRTRFGGRKVPPTREASETPSMASSPSMKRTATPAIDTKDGTPALKRLKITKAEPLQLERPKHPNQYTKAREAAARAAAEAAAAGIPPPSTQMPDWSKMTSEELRARKWTDEELIDSLKKDHTWLHADPSKSLEWKDKILNGINPVRSWSMVKKWAEWRRDNKDKRPRRKEMTPMTDSAFEGAPSPAVSGMLALEDIKREGTEERSEGPRDGTPMRRTIRNRS